MAEAISRISIWCGRVVSYHQIALIERILIKERQKEERERDNRQIDNSQVDRQEFVNKYLFKKKKIQRKGKRNTSFHLLNSGNTEMSKAQSSASQLSPCVEEAAATLQTAGQCCSPLRSFEHPKEQSQTCTPQELCTSMKYDKEHPHKRMSLCKDAQTLSCRLYPSIYVIIKIIR